MRKKYSKILLVMGLWIVALVGCALNRQGEAESVFHPITPTAAIEHMPPNATATTNPTDIPEETPSPVPTSTPTPTSVPTPTVTPSPTEVPVTATPTPTSTPTCTPTPTPSGKDLYLTFDDGPSPEYTMQLLDVLDRYQVKATFFVCRTKYPELIKEIHDRGHVIGIHSVTHDYYQIYASEEAFFEDVYTMQDFIYECTGVRTTLLRFPGGSSNTISNFNPGIMSRLVKLVEEKGFLYFDWNASTEDSSTEDVSVMVENAARYVHAWPHIMLLHHPENKQSSLDAVEALILWGIENDCTFKVVGPDAPETHHNVLN